MHTHARLRALSAIAGGSAVIGLGIFGMSFDTHTAHPESDTVVAPATGPNQTLDEATTSTAPSFRPVVTATPPPPPID